MPPYPCPSDLDLRAYSAGATFDADARILEGHLANCGSCLDRLNHLTLASNSLLDALRMPAQAQAEIHPALKHAVEQVVRVDGADHGAEFVEGEAQLGSDELHAAAIASQVRGASQRFDGPIDVTTASGEARGYRGGTQDPPGVVGEHCPERGQALTRDSAGTEHPGNGDRFVQVRFRGNE